MTALAPAGTAHEHYQTDDGRFSLVLGEQDEPVYTYDWTNLDLIVSEDPDNGTGDPVPGVHETVNATLVSPGGEELSLPIEPQFGEEGRYEFVEDYFLTQPGQYEVRLTGHVNGTEVNGTYKLPGPRPSMADRGFPTSPVPTLLDLETQQENERLRERVDRLETRVQDLRGNLSELRSQLADLEERGAAQPASQQGAPGLGLALVAGLVGLAALLQARRAD